MAFDNQYSPSDLPHFLNTIFGKCCLQAYRCLGLNTFFNTCIHTCLMFYVAYVSVGCCIVVLILIFRYKKLRATTSSRIIFYQTCCYFVEALSQIALPADLYTTCVLQGVFTEYTILASVLWGCSMSLLLHRVLYWPPTRGAYNPNKFIYLSHCVCWLVPLPFTIGPIITGKTIDIFAYLELFIMYDIMFIKDDYEQVNQSKAWCWFSDSGHIARVFRAAHYGTYFMLCVIILIVSISLWRKVCLLQFVL